MKCKHHRYRRVNIAKKGNPEYWVMQCIDCTSFTPMITKLSAPRLVGKIARCNKCDDPFELDRRALRMAKPVCNACTTHKVEKVQKVKSAEEFFKELENSVLTGED